MARSYLGSWTAGGARAESGNMFRNADCEKTQAPPDPAYDYRLKQQLDECAYQANQACAGQQIRPLMTEAQTLAELFRYHPPTDSTIPKFAAINQAAKNFAEVVLQNCPSSADRSAAIRSIRDARMTANAAVALNGLSL
jgi:hypothetical protein